MGSVSAPTACVPNHKSGGIPVKKLMIAVLAPALLAVPVALAQATKEKAPAAEKSQQADSKSVEFINKAAMSDMFEIQSSELALQKATDAKVKDFAKMMVSDHRAASDKLKSTVQSAQLPSPPTELDDKHKKKIDKLQSSSGREFDRAYLEVQLKGHKKAVELFSSYAKEGKNAELKNFAQQTLPTLEQHLKHVRTLEGSSS
jgi:putative membrane protein